MSELQEQEANRVSTEAKTTKCDACGGDMAFDPETQNMKCQFCDCIVDLKATNEQVVEIDLSDMKNFDFNWNIERKLVICQQCGGETLTEQNDETTFCSFCGSQHIVQREDNDMGMKPQGLIPYTLNQDKAKEQLAKWIKKRYLAPGDLKQKYLNQNLKGIYIPFWTFDADTYTRYTCEIGTYYYTGSGKERQRHTKWRNYGGVYRKFFDDHLVCAIKHEQQRYIKKIEPFDMKKVVDYSPQYLAGYNAQKYMVMPQDAFNTAKSEIAAEVRSSVISQLPGDTNRNYNQNCSFSNVTFKHLLLPVYMLAYSYNNKSYKVVVNGQTGEVQGQSPLSPIKVAILTVLIIAAIILIWTISK